MAAAVRREMLEEAIQVIRGLWKGDNQPRRLSLHRRERPIYSLPKQLPASIFVAAAARRPPSLRRGPATASSTAPNTEESRPLRRPAARGKPRYAELTVCWAADEARRRRRPKVWPISARGELARSCRAPPLRAGGREGPRRRRGDGAVRPRSGHRAALKKYVEAGFDHVGDPPGRPGPGGVLPLLQEVAPARRSRDAAPAEARNRG